MRHPADNRAVESLPVDHSSWPSHPDIEPRENRNLLLLAMHQIVLRLGWIFKTESVIMPAVLDQLAGAGWIRGFLPVLNRLGQSVPPVFCAERLKRLRRKKRALGAFTVLMSLPFAVLAVVWLGCREPVLEGVLRKETVWELKIERAGEYYVWVRPYPQGESAGSAGHWSLQVDDGRPTRCKVANTGHLGWWRLESGFSGGKHTVRLAQGTHRLRLDDRAAKRRPDRLILTDNVDANPPFGSPRRSWLPALFLGLYLAFFVFNGLYHLSFGTVQGKLIRPTRRGRLLLTATFWGSFPAMLMAWWLLGRWLKLPDGGFGYAFIFTAVCFFVSGLTTTVLFEPADRDGHDGPARPGSLVETVRALRLDGNLRRLVVVAGLFASALILFPHYQALARQSLGLAGGHLTAWVITQNASVGILSVFVGTLADRRGNRLTLRLLLFGSAVAPAFAIALPHLPGQLGARMFWLVFIPLGMAPLVMRTMLNYALEIGPPKEHPRYLSTVSLGLAVPFLLSPAVGWLIDAAGFEVVFVSTVCLTLASGVLTFRLAEPRHHLAGDIAETVGVEGAE